MSGGGGGFNPLGSVANAVGQITGTNQIQSVMQQAATANLNQQGADRSQAMGLAEATPQEIQQLQQAVTLNSQDVARKQKLIDSSDPALIEAGKQALSLMQGKQAAALGPIQEQRDQQRKSLESTLSQRLGSDYATSSAGIQALSDFDKQTNQLMTNAQQSTLSQFLGVAQNVSGSIGNMQNNISDSLGIQNQYGSIQNRQISALQNNRVDQTQSYTGSLMNAVNNSSLITAGISGAYQNKSAIGDSMQSGFGSLSSLFGGSAQAGSVGASGAAGSSALVAGF